MIMRQTYEFRLSEFAEFPMQTFSHDNVDQAARDMADWIRPVLQSMLDGEYMEDELMDEEEMRTARIYVRSLRAGVPYNYLDTITNIRRALDQMELTSVEIELYHLGDFSSQEWFNSY